MEHVERIRNHRRLNIFNRLKEEKTLVKMRVPGKAYERLTVVTDVWIKDGRHFFLVDFPDDFDTIVKHVPSSGIHFEFFGKDKIRYRFKTPGKDFSGGNVPLELPKVIERLQRRDYFRFAPPLGTKIYAKKKRFPIELNVVNVSLGGVLCAEARFEKTGAEDPAFKIGSTFNNAVLIFPCEDKVFRIHIKKVLIKRIEKKPESSRNRWALQFVDMAKEEEKRLNEILYRLQRYLLRKRPQTVLTS